MSVDLKDITFTIPVRIDSRDRYQNLICIINHLLAFNTNIIIFENGPNAGEITYSHKDVKIISEKESGPFHRTKYLNKMARLATTKFIANYDCDVMFPYKQIVKAYNILQNNEADIVYPYDGLFVNIPRSLLLTKGTEVCEQASVNTLNPEDYPNFGKSSMGGALFLNRQVFIDSGMENEYFISWGAEDWERFRRFVKLGYRVGRVKGPLFHIDHARKQDSNENNPYYQRNVAEYQKVDTLPVEQLKEYIKTWPWLSL
jgi:predicted glycosyltransferase involved in capsule biosynthesis